MDLDPGQSGAAIGERRSEVTGLARRSAPGARRCVPRRDGEALRHRVSASRPGLATGGFLWAVQPRVALFPRRWLLGPGRACASPRPLRCCGLALPELRSLAPSRLRCSRPVPRLRPLPLVRSFPFSLFSAALCPFPLVSPSLVVCLFGYAPASSCAPCLLA